MADSFKAICVPSSCLGMVKPLPFQSIKEITEGNITTNKSDERQGRKAGERRLDDSGKFEKLRGSVH